MIKMTEEIISQIKRNLSGNPDLDRDYLVSQLDYYQNHESSYEIIKEISAMIWQSLDFYQECCPHITIIKFKY